jgi:hypothetical protein
VADSVPWELHLGRETGSQQSLQCRLVIILLKTQKPAKSPDGIDICTGQIATNAKMPATLQGQKIKGKKRDIL